MSPSEAISIVEPLLLDDLIYTLLNADANLIAVIAETNAIAWVLDDYQDLQAWFEGSEKIHFSVSLDFSGDQLPDKMFCGNRIIALLKGEVGFIEGKWAVESYQIKNTRILSFWT